MKMGGKIIMSKVQECWQNRTQNSSLKETGLERAAQKIPIVMVVKQTLFISFQLCNPLASGLLKHKFSELFSCPLQLVRKQCP